jgi:hypothetical protein
MLESLVLLLQGLVRRLQALAHMVLVKPFACQYHLLSPERETLDRQLMCALVRKEIQASGCTLHDDCWAQTTKNTCFVVLSRPQIGHHHIVRAVQSRFARWARARKSVRSRELRVLGAPYAEYVAASRNDSLICELGATVERVALMNVVHCAWRWCLEGRGGD